MMASDWRQHPASFRDPGGFVFESEGRLLRAIQPVAQRDFDRLIESGLHAELSDLGHLVRHDDLGIGALEDVPEARVIAPQRLDVISFACEWTFAQLKAAALLTLEVQCRALSRGFTLKDASAFNVQFIGARPVMVDTLSFIADGGDGPWVAYRQFCEHFLGPLALRRFRPEPAWALAQAQIDGVPMLQASELLPLRTWWKPGLAIHLHLHARVGASERATHARRQRRKVTPDFGLQLARSLQSAVNALTLDHAASSWSDYRRTSTYAGAEAEEKSAFVSRAVSTVRPRRALDLGANDGLHSALLVGHGVPCTAVEFDAGCAEAIYARSLGFGAVPLNTLRVDLANPTPAHGWGGEERAAFATRLQCDLVLALALIHHLAITRQVPYARIAHFFAQLGRHLVVEFVPPDDPMALQLLAARTGIPDAEALFGKAAFLQGFGAHFEVLQQSRPLAGGRTLFLMARRGTTH